MISAFSFLEEKINNEEQRSKENNAVNDSNSNNKEKKPEMFDMFNEDLGNLENSTLSTNLIK